MKKLNDVAFEAAVVAASVVINVVNAPIKAKAIVDKKIDRVQCAAKNRKAFKAGGSYDKAMQYMKNRTQKGDLVDLGEKKI